MNVCMWGTVTRLGVPAQIFVRVKRDFWVEIGFGIM